MKKRIGILVAVLTACAFGSSVYSQSITVGDVTAAPGEKKTGYIHVPEGKASPAEQLPVTVVNGVEDGPTLALIAGTHGYEYPPVLAMHRVARQLDPQFIAGKVIIVHVLNMPSFMKRTVYYNPYDWQNQNRMFPGKEDGTSSERIAYQVTKEVIEQCDYLIDNHCGDGNEDLMQYLYCTYVGDERVDAMTRKIADNYGLKVIILEDDRPKDSSASVYVTNTALLMGKPAITIEAGKLGRTDEADIDAIVVGTFNTMKVLDMIPGEPELVAEPVYVTNYEIVRAEADGVFYPLVTRAQHVEQNEVVGYLTDFFGNITHKVRAPFDGIVLYVVATPPMSEGEPMISVGEFRK